MVELVSVGVSVGVLSEVALALEELTLVRVLAPLALSEHALVLEELALARVLVGVL